MINVNFRGVKDSDSTQQVLKPPTYHNTHPIGHVQHFATALGGSSIANVSTSVILQFSFRTEETAKNQFETRKPSHLGTYVPFSGNL